MVCLVKYVEIGCLLKKWEWGGYKTPLKNFAITCLYHIHCPIRELHLEKKLDVKPNHQRKIHEDHACTNESLDWFQQTKTFEEYGKFIKGGGR
jgi:hypothetical protein